MVQYVAILMKYYELALWSPHAFTGYKDDCHSFEEKCPPAAHEYKQLCSGNCYHPLDLSNLTVSACAYRNCTDYHKVSKSAVFSYPARHLELGLPKKEKLKTKFPPLVHKPQVTEDPAPIDKQIAIRVLLLWPTICTDKHSNKYKHFDFHSK